ncbi:hypothetical protein [Alkanindiges illinoisensis]|uniref:Uncharacterized protein n=1 Tax=Alkanindiges illinoisensis TaxID=197183 RepID=A0A4Y7X8I1_9GAMM|nr:hypothetical protein [Alkanindiges illinoisensis]TEU23328.1 hypothetical protein E2B99_13485 [Alkanindiges illinoisensis]
MSKRYLVLDKSYLRSVSKAKVEELEEKFIFLLPLAAVYEIIKDEKYRAQLLAKFTDENSYEILPSPKKLIDFEAEFLKPVIKPSKLIQLTDKSNHKSFINKEFKLTSKQQKAIEEEMDFYQDLTTQFIENELKAGFDLKENRPDFFAKIQEIPDWNRVLIDSIKEGKKIPFKNIPERIDENWYMYRFHQLNHHLRMDILNRYENIDTILESKKTIMKINHDLIDLLYLVEGILEGAFATKEKRLINFWEKFAPENGILIKD